MPNESIEAAYAEVLALAPDDRVELATLEIRHPDPSKKLFLVRDRVAHNLTLEADNEGPGETVEFEPVPFRMTLPTSGENGFQELNIALDNTDRRITDFLEEVSAFGEPVEIVYRPYLSDQPEAPQMSPPLVLVLTEAQITPFEVAGRATFTGIINAKYPTELYDRRQFPSLGQ